MASRAFEIINKKTKYENPWMSVSEYEITRDGKRGLYGVVTRADAVSVIASTNDGRILFLRQYRFPTEGYSWELPMGGLDPGEDPAQCAIRELQEETGLKLPVHEIGSFYPIPGLTPQRSTAFRALIPDSQLANSEQFDAVVDEIVERRLLTEAEIRQMVHSGEISDGFTLCSLALMYILEQAPKK